MAETGVALPVNWFYAVVSHVGGSGTFALSPVSVHPDVVHS